MTRWMRARSWFRYRRLLAGLLQPELRRVPSKRKPRSLYAKLGAHSRAGASERARALGLLAPSARQR